MNGFELLLFYAGADDAASASAAGIDALVVDWERRGKERRQLGADTEVNLMTVEDLRRAREAAGARIICRTDSPASEAAEQLELAIANGADEVLLPMVTEPGEVEEVLDRVAGRAGVGILIETQRAVEAATELASLRLSRVYVGLNDLAIERGSESIFDAIADGTVERLADEFEAPFGFGGLTLPERGAPIPCRLLIAEMARIGASFSFMRRSYRRDLGPDGDHRHAVRRIRRALTAAQERAGEVVRAEHDELLSAIASAAPPLRAL